MSLGFTKQEFDITNNVLENIISVPTETIEVELDFPPKIENLTDSNKSYKLKCAILFIDIRKSTDLSDTSHAKSMVKIYRSFMRMTVECVRKCGGVTRQFLGDRIMGVFMDEYDEKGNLTYTAVDKSIYAARSMQTLLDYSLNPLLNTHMNHKTISCGIGISYGDVLVTQVGMRGVENDDSRENEKDVVWVGKITNYASKYADLTSGGEIFINKMVFSKMADNLKHIDDKDIWEEVSRSKGDVFYNGFITKCFYLENVGDFEREPYKNDKDIISIKNPYIDLIKDLKYETDLIVTTLLNKQTNITRLEMNLKAKEDELKKSELDITNQKEMLAKKAKNIYSNEKNILSKTYCKYELIKLYSYSKWEEITNSIFESGKLCGMSKLDIEKDIATYLIDIYRIFGLYDKSYYYLCIMAKYSTWLSNEYILVIPKVKTKYAIVDIIEARINTLSDGEQKTKFKEHLETINKLPII